MMLPGFLGVVAFAVYRRHSEHGLLAQPSRTPPTAG